MPTIVTRTIGTGGDYSTIQAWEDACPANLVAADQIWRGELKAQTFAAGVAIGGQTTDATRYVELTTEAGASFADHANVRTNALRYNASNGAAISAGGDFGYIISNTAAFTRITKIQAQATGGNNFSVFRNAGSGAVFEQCLGETAGGKVFELSQAATYRNCVAIVMKSSTGRAWEIATSFASVALFNCLAVRPSNYTAGETGFFWSFTNPVFKNCAVFGFTTAFTSANTPTGSNNATDRSSIGFGSANLTSLTYASQFQNASAASGTHDFRLATGASLIDAGTSTAADGVTIDIGGFARSGTYDIGPWEAGPTSTPATATPGAGQLTLTGRTPTVGAGATASPGVAHLVLQGLAVTARAAATARPGPAALAWQGWPPLAIAASIAALPPAERSYSATLPSRSYAVTLPARAYTVTLPPRSYS